MDKKWLSGLVCDVPDAVKEIIKSGDVMEALSAYWAQTENYLRALPCGNETIMTTSVVNLASNLMIADELRKIRMLLEEK